MFNVVLYQPEIPPNTGNIIRLCANTGCRLHLIEPLGFSLDDKQVRRAGLDYHEFASVTRHTDLTCYLQTLDPGHHIWAFSTRGTRSYAEVQYRKGDSLLFGPETRGLPLGEIQALPGVELMRLPMLPESRSLNLSNTVAVVVYEAWRQLDFSGGI